MSLAERDVEHIWHPYTQMKDMPQPIPIVRGEGAYLYDEEGNRYIDAISSWWVNVHGHAHPHIAERVSKQLSELEHVIFAGFTHPPAVELAERLLALLPHQEKVFFSDNGSTAVEVAIKMALQYWNNKGEHRKRIIALEGAYHGDTFGSMSVSGRGAFTAPFDELLFDVEHLPFPTEGNEEKTVQALEQALNSDTVAFIYEPLVQGAAGMRMYAPELLNRLVSMCKEKGVLAVADEVMTGFGRTGKMFASDNMENKPDIMCFSKGLTGGTMAMGLTTCSGPIFDAFLSDNKKKTFFHGHSFTANPVACSASCASLDIFEQPETFRNIDRICNSHQKFIEKLGSSNLIRDARQCGTIVAIELETGEDTSSYFDGIRERIYGFFMDKGLLLRPLGNVIYILPPYCIKEEDLDTIYASVLEFLESLRV